MSDSWKIYIRIVTIYFGPQLIIKEEWNGTFREYTKLVDDGWRGENKDYTVIMRRCFVYPQYV